MTRYLQRAAIAWLILVGGAGGVWGEAVDEESRDGVGRPAAQSATVRWENVPLYEAITRLAAVFDQPVFVDRRIDKSRRIRLKTENASLDEILRQLGAEQSLGVCRVGGTIYLGPVASAERLQRLSAMFVGEIEQLPYEPQNELEDRLAMEWNRRSTPRSLVKEAVHTRGWELRDEALIPHDLWDSGRLPATTLTDQLSLLLIGFELSFRLLPDEHVIQIIPLEKVTIPASPIAADGDRAPGPLLNQSAPTPIPTSRNRATTRAEQSTNGGRLHHVLTEATGQRGSPRAKPKTKQVYTLRVEEQPVGLILRGLAQRLEWHVEIDEAALQIAGLSLEKRVSFSVKNADADELLSALLAPAGIAFEIDGQRVLISAPSK